MTPPPARKLAVLACMDARLDPAELLGLEQGDAHVIRNAGGVVSDDALRSLAISQNLLGTEEIVLIHHTDCGMLTFTDDEFAHEARAGDGRAARSGRSTPSRPRAERARLDPQDRAEPVRAAHRQRARASSTTSRRAPCARSADPEHGVVGRDPPELLVGRVGPDAAEELADLPLPALRGRRAAAAASPRRAARRPRSPRRAARPAAGPRRCARRLRTHWVCPRGATR